MRFNSSLGALAMTLINLCEMFSDDERCRELLERLRWPEGITCIRCSGKSVVRLTTNKKLFYCKDCDYQFTVTSNTIFHDSHLPLIKWFTTTHLLCEAKKGMSAHQVHRTVGMSYKTAWYLCHRIRAAMATCDKPMLNGTVEIDETYVGGRKRRGTAADAKQAKEVVLGIRQRNGELRFFHAEDAKSATLAQFIRDNVSTDVDVIMTDDFAAYPNAMRKTGNIAKHKTINHSTGVYVKGDIYTNTVESAFSLLKRGIIGTWHRISAKHLPAYLEEMSFRFNRRKNPNLFLDTLRHMVTTDPLTFERLTA
jgi:transposase-like protein